MRLNLMVNNLVKYGSSHSYIAYFSRTCSIFRYATDSFTINDTCPHRSHTQEKKTPVLQIPNRRT